jgi:mono/diheme cytochrome c family protein
MTDMMDGMGWIMADIGLIWLFVIIVLVLAAAALIKHLLGRGDMSKLRFWGRLLTIFVVAAATFGWLIYARLLGQDDAAQLTFGAKLYAERCAACHGAKLEGQANWQEALSNGRMPAPPHDASGHTWHHSDEELLTITKKGLTAVVPGYESDMPAFEGSLSDDEIRAILAFIKSTWPKTEREYQQARSRPAT